MFCSSFHHQYDSKIVDSMLYCKYAYPGLKVCLSQPLHYNTTQSCSFLSDMSDQFPHSTFQEDRTSRQLMKQSHFRDYICQLHMDTESCSVFQLDNNNQMDMDLWLGLLLLLDRSTQLYSLGMNLELKYSDFIKTYIYYFHGTLDDFTILSAI